MASHPEVAHFDWSWVWMQMATYVKLEAEADHRRVEKTIVDVVRRHGSPFPRIGFYYDDVHAAGGRYDFMLQPMDDVYLGSAAIGKRWRVCGMNEPVKPLNSSARHATRQH